MLTFPSRAKEPFKTALSIVLAYGIALQMNWDNPYWAGFAVAFCSLSTIGQSFNKAAMRMFGTLVAAFFALLCIALFPQDRWLFMLFLSSYVGFCTYMSCGAKQQYFWNICGFVCVIICMDAGADPVNAFETAVLRTEETGLGILVYSLVSILLWPATSQTGFIAITTKLITDQHQFFRAVFALKEWKDVGNITTLSSQLVQDQTQFNQLLGAAETDIYEVWELRRQWRLYKAQATKITEVIRRCREGFAEIQTMEMSPVFSNLELFINELDTQFTLIEQMLAGKEPEKHPVDVELVLDRSNHRSASHFKRAMLIVFQDRLLELKHLTLSQFETVSEIRGFGTKVTPPAAKPSQSNLFVPDPDRMLAVVRVVLAIWLAYLAVIYIDSVPGSLGFVTMTAVFAMITASMPQFPVRKMFVPIAFGVGIASLIYLLVMPHLSTFLSLGLLIFVVTFAFSYLFDAPQKGLAKVFGLAMFVMIISINNQQTYSFMVVATNILMWPLLFFILAITSSFPRVLLPDKSFLRLLGRYYHSFDYLLSGLSRDVSHPTGRFTRWSTAFHRQELSSIPVKLGAWAKFLDYTALTTSSPQQVQTILTNLQVLSGHILELIEKREALTNHILLQELNEDAKNWQRYLKKAIESLNDGSGHADRIAFNARLDDIMRNLEIRITSILNNVTEEQVKPREAENLYRLLGAYRGASEALVEYVGSVDAIDWVRWREERF